MKHLRIKRGRNRAGSLALLLLLAWGGQAQQTYTITTVAGNGTAGFAGDSGAATAADLNLPSAVVYAGGNLYIADVLNQRIRFVSGGNISTIAGTGTSGLLGDGGKALSAEFANPSGVAVDGSGNVYVADTGNHLVRKVTKDGIISTVAGAGNELTSPLGLALDSAGNLYIANTGNNSIDKLPAGGTALVRVAGSGTQGSSGDGGLATRAQLNHPSAVAVDANNRIYVADRGNQVIRMIDARGFITTVAGTLNVFGYSGDGGPATQAKLSYPSGVGVDAGGNLFITDNFNQRVRMVDVSGNISTIAGNGGRGYTGDGAAATSAQLNYPSGLSLDTSGNIYFADSTNSVVRQLTPAGTPGGSLGTPSITGVINVGSFGAFTETAPGSWIEIYGTNLAAASRGWTLADFSGTDAPTALDRTSVTVSGQAAFVSYVSPGQVNVQVPSNVPLGSQQIVVSTAAASSAPYPMNINATEPGLYAPLQVKIGGKQYVGAQFLDYATWVLPSTGLAGFPSRPAKPGDTIVLYGVGFGGVNTGTPAGQIAPASSVLNSPVQILFGTTPVTPSYWGLAPGAVGLYQFNVTVPVIPDNDAVPLSFTLGGVSGTQTLYTAVKN